MITDNLATTFSVRKTCKLLRGMKSGHGGSLTNDDNDDSDDRDDKNDDDDNASRFAKLRLKIASEQHCLFLLP